MEPVQPNTSSAPLSYEQNLTELQRVVELLERGALTLEDSLELYEKGMALSARCEEQLAEAEARIITLGAKDAERSLRKEVPLHELSDEPSYSEAASSVSTGGEL